MTTRHNKAPRRGLRRAAVVATLGVVGAVGTIGGMEYNQAQAAEYNATQADIAPVIAGAMIKADNDALVELATHPDKVITINAPGGHKDAVELTNGQNWWVIMGTTNGAPDPNKPMFVDYLNNAGTPGKRGIRIVMTAPGGNWQVDQLSYAGFGGTTKGGATPDGGWGAVVPGQCDTTDRGYGGDSGPPPLEAAQAVAQTAQQFPLTDPYLYE